MVNDAIQEILSLQKDYSPTFSDSMVRRRLVVEGDLRAKLEDLMKSEHELSHLRVDASSGIGNNSVIPWVRIFDPMHSPSAQSGWYLVFLFSADGSSCYLSLDLGVTNLSKEEIEQERASAVFALERASMWKSAVGQFNEEIDLRAKQNDLARKYERGNLLSLQILTDQVLDDSAILQAILELENLRQVVVLSSNRLAEKRGKLSPEFDELDRLVSLTGWGKDRILELLSSITDKTPQIVLYGPPGTGKTFVAREFARYLLATGSEFGLGDRIRLVQFHPSYGYEEFVEGIRPNLDANGQMIFEAVRGTILEMSDAIEEDGQTRVLIIDEMNRANLPRVFGELLFMLEYRDQPIDLMLRKGFALPSKLLIIGTMNTADKSIKYVDTALRRRFDFFSVDPDVNILKAHYVGRPNSLGDSLFDGFEMLNRKLRADVGEMGYEIGHSYFMRDEMTSEVMNSLWRLQILPLISDYFADRYDVIEGYSVEVFWPNA